MSQLTETLSPPSFLPSAFEEISNMNRIKAEAAAREQEKRDWCHDFLSRAKPLLDTKNTSYSLESSEVAAR